ncbi:PTS sugar transporter subunit IIA [Nocardioides panaciterrulae]|uniref:PTS system fructose-specific IIC component n=1 Tax=Nocardioides panaciterrulae TaxID=661492 RepID=A0A7Y9E9I4_9ACTN|nr:PTS sugar transporter subunit IIA [Nocardioides panaciterrulae]NYD43589.1 PTS system fructose-specific IIC component [Nocardioides panaciterrulae]
MTSSPAPFTTADLVTLDHPGGQDARDVVASLAARLTDAGRVSDAEAFVEAVMVREALESTVLPGGLALPHARSAAVDTLSVAVARLAAPVSFHDDKPDVDVVLLIAAPEEDPSSYLALLAKIAGACVRTSFRTELRGAGSADEAAGLVTGAIGRI